MMQKKIPNTNGLIKKTDLNAKATEIEGKISGVCGLATNSALISVENKIPDVSNSVKKTDYDAKISDIGKKVTDHDHDKYITTSEFNKLTAENFTARLTQANLVTKTDFDAKLKSLNKKINANKTKNLLVENKSKKSKNLNSSYFRGRNYFGDDGKQNYLVFYPMNKYFKRIVGVGDDEYIYFLKSKGFSDESLNSITASNCSITP